MKKTLLSTICILALNVGFNAQANATALNDDCPGDIVTYYLDSDGDGFGNPSNAIEGCSTEGAPLGYTADNTDCNDQLANIWFLNFLWADADADGYTIGTPIEDCFGDSIAPGFYPFPTGEDCNDNDVLVYQSIDLFADVDGDGITGGLQAVCYGDVVPEGYSIGPNGLDCNDFNAAVSSVSTWYLDADADNYFTEEVQSCDAPGAGYVQFSNFLGDCNDANPFAYQSATLFIDNDLDGYTNGMGLVCFGASIPANRPISTLGEDCNDDNASINPLTAEVCDGQDNNCDGQVDEGFAQVVYFADADGDGFGGSASVSSCSQPSGYVSVGGDCNDASAAINPSATEICDGLDNNCDGSIDEGVLSTFYADADADGFGSASSTQACSQPSGYVSNSSDCNDASAVSFPDATEICDGLDNNCNGLVNEGVGSTFFADADGDGFGSASSTLACSQPSGYVSNSSDCNDASASINPAAAEVCNGIDDNCDGIIDGGASSTVYFLDADADGFGNPAISITTCIQPSGYVADNTDCNDNSSAANPSATEIADNIDNNCNGIVDEGFTRLSNASCGITLSSLNASLSIIAVAGATDYRYRFVNASLGFSSVYTRGNSSLSMNTNNVNLVLGSITYTVTVAARVGGVWGAYGLPCSITTPAIPVPSIASSDCGRAYRLGNGELEIANDINGSQRYQFEITPTNGGAAILVSTNDDELELEDVNGLQEGASYTVRARVRVAGIWSNFGPSCSFSIKAAPTTEIDKCGRTVRLNTNIGLEEEIHGATKYEVRLVRVNGGNTHNLVLNASCNVNFKLNQIAGIATGNSYSVSVRAFRNGAWGLYGSACTITVSTSNRLDDEMEGEAENLVSVYPNPFQNEMTVRLNAEGQESNIVITDLAGRIVMETKTTAAEIQLGSNLSKGMYYIDIVSGDMKKVVSAVKE